MDKQRTLWIDQMRGICMLAILLFHTEAYYAGTDLIPYNYYVANVLTAFFFLSGYLFHRNERPFSLSRKLHAIVRSILIPYFVFTLLLALPKALTTDHTLPEVLINIFLGKGSWFVATLAMAEIEFALVLSFRKNWLFHLMPWLAIIIAWLLTGRLDDAHNYWKLHNSLIAYFFLYAGHLVNRYKHLFSRFASPLLIPLCLALLIPLKIYIQHSHQSWVVDGVEVTCYPLFIVDMLTGIILLIEVSQLLPRWYALSFVGQHSLYYYFFCGAVPMAVATLLHHISFDYAGFYWQVILCFLLNCVFSTFIVWIITHYFVFLPKNKLT